VKVIPVIDILNRVAVHAVRGKRNQYQPLKSVLCDSTDPVAVASAFKRCGFEELYVADLDAIMAYGENFSVLEEIAEKTGLRLMVDAGVSDLNQVQQVFWYKVSKVIVGTETLPALGFVKQAVDTFGSGKVTVSLDLNAGKVLSKSESLQSMSALELACALQGVGVGELIVLDLARVGSGEGPDFTLLKQLLDNLKVRVLVGGAVSSLKELIALRDIGVYGVLMATALHSGKIAPADLQSAGLMPKKQSTIEKGA
jgi:phosphoribosylformimino-5-aminoimidazole carboxamide ribotide isomerase